jgi:hypothetical protein
LELYINFFIPFINIYYRIVQSDSTTPSDGNNKSSSWINANSFNDANGNPLNEVTTGTWQTNTVEGSTTNLTGLLGAGTGITISGSDAILKVSNPGITVTTSTIYIIFRIGLPMSKDVGFKSVQAMIS